MRQITPTSVLDKLIDTAGLHLYISYPDKLRYEHALAKGEPIPDRCKPGALLNSLSAEEREALSRLTSDEASRYRLEWWM